MMIPIFECFCFFSDAVYFPLVKQLSTTRLVVPLSAEKPSEAKPQGQ